MTRAEDDIQYVEVNLSPAPKERADGSRRSYDVTIAATSSIKGITLDIDALDTSTYMQNPVVLFAHGRGQSALPVGKTIRLEKEVVDNKPQLRAEFEFLEGDAFADRVKHAWDEGHLRGASVGWVNDSQGAADGRRRPRMLEWSIVSVPADVAALRRDAEALSRQEVEKMADEKKDEKNSSSGSDIMLQVFDRLVSMENSNKEFQATVNARMEALEAAAKSEPEPAASDKPDTQERDEKAQTIDAEELRKVASAVHGSLTNDAMDGMETRELIEYALGAELPADAKTRSDEYLFGILSAVHQRRQSGAAQADGRVSGPSVPRIGAWGIHDIQDMADRQNRR